MEILRRSSRFASFVPQNDMFPEMTTRLGFKLLIDTASKICSWGSVGLVAHFALQVLDRCFLSHSRQ
jgi:hypothetical protein